MATQRNFAVMGENLFHIISKIIENKKVCRLLKYQDANPLAVDKPDVDGTDLLHKQIIIVPRIPEEGIECSFVIVVFDNLYPSLYIKTSLYIVINWENIYPC